MKALAFILLIFCALQGVSQTTVPSWVKVQPSRTQTYYYRVSSGTGFTKEEAQRKALAMIIIESALAVGIPIDISRLEKLNSDSLMISASSYVKIPINKVCDYTEELTTRRGYRTYILCQVANDARIIPQFKSFDCLLNKEEE